MKGENIHILEELPLAGGSLDGILNPTRGFIIRGGREMEDHFECLWDLFRSIPSLEVEDASVLDEFYWLNKEDPNFSKCRVIENKGQRIPDDGQFTLSDKSSEEMVKLYMTSESELQGLKITDVFSEESSNQTSGLIGLVCLRLKNGIQRLKCAVISYVSFTISMVYLTYLL